MTGAGRHAHGQVLSRPVRSWTLASLLTRMKIWPHAFKRPSPRFAGPGCCAARRALSRLTGSRPSRAAIPDATRPGRLRRLKGRGLRPLPCPGPGGQFFLPAVRERARLDGLAVAAGNAALCGAAPARPSAPVTRHTRCRAAEIPSIQSGPARPPRQSLRLMSRRSRRRRPAVSVRALRHAGFVPSAGGPPATPVPPTVLPPQPPSPW
jgi:hypothetical protein